MIIENTLLKDKLGDIQERFKRVDEKREDFIKELQDKVSKAEIEVSKRDGRQKNADKLSRQLQDVEG